ncbi:uncharacterized protein [Miscanthus floridulus]|uniref:uncharacterized protein n=1 Tax=Miscanthus floridulus TaxID=154761 RepID=UPI00345A00FF
METERQMHQNEEKALRAQVVEAEKRRDAVVQEALKNVEAMKNECNALRVEKQKLSEGIEEMKILVCNSHSRAEEGHHMSEVLEERTVEEVIKWDEAIEALQKELDKVEDEKKRLSAEVADLRVAHQTADDLKIQVGALEKDVAGLKVAEEIALARF